MIYSHTFFLFPSFLFLLHSEISFQWSIKLYMAWHQIIWITAFLQLHQPMPSGPAEKGIFQVPSNREHHLTGPRSRAISATVSTLWPQSWWPSGKPWKHGCGIDSCIKWSCFSWINCVLPLTLLYVFKIILIVLMLL